MSTTPNWLGATAGSAPQAGQINQFLGTHLSQELYAANATASVVTSGAATTGTNGLYLAQSFTTAVGQTTVGYVRGPISTTVTTGTLLAPTTLSLYANASGAPTGSALVSTTLTAEYAYLSTSNGNTNVFTTYPLPATGLTASTTYWLVLAAAGDASHQYTWFRSASASGASTSTNGTTWTAQAYGFRYTVYDQAASGLLTCTWEDSGARWTARTYTAAELLSTYGEYTVGQGTNGYVQSYRTMAYSNGLLTGVS